jgi:hypothetical protein
VALSINTNLSSLATQRALIQSQNLRTAAMQRLSSGLRINAARDDAAGLAISGRLTAQIRGLTQLFQKATGTGKSFSTVFQTTSRSTCILRLLVLLKPDQVARMGRVSAGAIKKVRRSAVLRSPFRQVVHAGKSFEVRILRPQLCIRTPCSGEDDAVGQRQRCIQVDHSSLLHQSDAAQRSAFVTLLQHALEHLEHRDRRHQQRTGVLDRSGERICAGITTWNLGDTVTESIGV